MYRIQLLGEFTISNVKFFPPVMSHYCVILVRGLSVLPKKARGKGQEARGKRQGARGKREQGTGNREEAKDNGQLHPEICFYCL
jgi:hypothetical protein